MSRSYVQISAAISLSFFCSSPGSRIRLQIGHGKQQPQKNKNKKRNTKKDEKDARLLSPPGWLTRGRGEKRRDEIVQQLAELLRVTGI
jgi:exopolysaccharide biosynthesis protein